MKIKIMLNCENCKFPFEATPEAKCVCPQCGHENVIPPVTPVPKEKIKLN